MFWRKKELTAEERLVIAVQEVYGWYEFVKVETDLTIAAGSNGADEVEELDMSVKDAKALERALKATIDFLEPIAGGDVWNG